MRRAIQMVLLTAGILLSTNLSAQTAVRYFQKGPIYEYRIKLLELVLQKTRTTDGEATAAAIGPDVTQTRGLEMLGSGQIDVATLGTTLEREARFLPIKVDILRGVLGYRIFLIDGRAQARFEQVHTLEDLRRWKAGFGSQWADIAILQENRLPVNGVADAALLIPMLMGGRFDYFPRGINEAWVELQANHRQYPRLTVEHSLALFYPYPVYFFVRKDNTRLADRIQRGLDAALKDGSFKALFQKYHKDLLRKTALGRRRIFTLTNPDLPSDTPKIDTSWWLPAAF